MKLNKYGKKMKNLDAVSKATRQMGKIGSSYSMIIYYDTHNDTVFYTGHVGDRWSVYDDPDIQWVMRTTTPCSQQYIADMIYESVLCEL